MRLILALLVLLLELWALARLFGTPAGRGRKLLWSAAIVALPVIGVGLWLATAQRR